MEPPIKMETVKASDQMHYEGTCIRPPPEADSILLQVTLGCSHNQCTFCGTYKDKRFAIKEERIILGDILYAARHMPYRDRVFLMDGDALIIPQNRLLWILKSIRKHLPHVNGVGTYANTKSIDSKSEQQLLQLRENGLDTLYLGVESGDDQVRQAVRKGSSAQHCLEMGQRAKAAGMRLVVLVLLGISGERWRQNARATGELLTAMAPDHVSALTVIPIAGTAFDDQLQRGEIRLPDERGFLLELREMLVHTELSGGVFASTHASNYLSFSARLPEEKQSVLDKIDAALRGDISLKPEWMRAY
jgi:radical SAM superfamily enzyme YgiQ (UPF0313 family)